MSAFMDTSKTRSNEQGELRACCQCQALYVPSRASQAFCGARCRQQHYVDHGAEGEVRVVRRLKSGASVTLHFRGPPTETALKFALGQLVRLVAKS